MIDLNAIFEKRTKTNAPPFTKEIRQRVQAAQVPLREGQQEPQYRVSVLNEGWAPMPVLQGGRCMEVSKMSIEMARDELAKSKEELQQVANDMMAVNDHVLGLLSKQIKEIRSARMTVTSETGQLLVSLRDVRKFFMEDAHVSEIARLEQFVSLCQGLRQLVEDGTLDEIVTVILRLGVKA